jgi:hypothetical protein
MVVKWGARDMGEEALAMGGSGGSGDGTALGRGRWEGALGFGRGGAGGAGRGAMLVVGQVVEAAVRSSWKRGAGRNRV